MLDAEKFLSAIASVAWPRARLRACLLAASALLLAACGGGGGGSPATAPTPATPPVVVTNPNTPTINASVVAAYSGQTVTFTGSATDPNNQALTYSWDFGDGSPGNGSSPVHIYQLAGTYTVTLTVRNTSGLTASATTIVGVVNSTNSSTSLSVDCIGTGCAAVDSTTYSGSGTGQWRYVNASSSDATINFTINGVAAGRNVTLLYSNGGNATSPTPPNSGTLADRMPIAPPVLADIAATLTETAIINAQDDAHSQLLGMNRELTRALMTSSRDAPSLVSAVSADAALVPAKPLAAPAINTSRTWNDLFNSTSSPTQYFTQVRSVCSVPNGRNVVIWVDPNAEANGKVNTITPPTTVQSFASTFCNASGGYDRLTTLLGDAWGSTRFNNLIADAPLQDINIVIVNAPPSASWAGYFYGYNNFLKTPPSGSPNPNSNEALVFFINADSVSRDLNFTLSTLIHETTHMVNFYQRSILLNPARNHDTWLEETSAMMSEDIIGPSVIKNPDNSGYNKIAQSRLPLYVQTGGNVSYINWPTFASSSPNYNLGGSFGAFLNRRYGLAIYTQLLSNCNDGTAGTTSYACLDTIIKARGGIGFADDFAHFGASIFATLPPPTGPSFYGYPAKTDGAYTLPAIDVSAFASRRPATAATLSSGYTATTHTYQIDTVAAGKTSYVRSGVVVPANTTLLVVIK